MLKLSPEQIVEAIKQLARDERQQLSMLLSRQDDVDSLPNFEKLSPAEQMRLSELMEKQKTGAELFPQEKEELETLLERGEALTLKNMAAYIQHLETQDSKVGPAP